MKDWGHRAIQFLIFTNNHLPLLFISFSRLFTRSLRCNWFPCQMDDLSLLMPIVVEEYILQNPIKMFIGVHMHMGVHVGMMTKNTYICLCCISLYIFVYMSCRYQEATLKTLLYGTFSLVSCRNFPHT